MEPSPDGTYRVPGVLSPGDEIRFEATISPSGEAVSGVLVPGAETQLELTIEHDGLSATIRFTPGDRWGPVKGGA